MSSLTPGRGHRLLPVGVGPLRLRRARAAPAMTAGRVAPARA
ncbi:hypothetical protein QOZ88_05035 [Blastococcus sp. BMG 814]|uniref:Uncharacterized protein n=1 Tax=Blastococcus carthaginiensis TaxID=3050034 RepID=A0ABT9I8U2_9ACTN|nr:hypothetical protein [Blastococcus carthaginiensis]MDP5181994.1 hypothetical protein [Blastococcus carthaginiensis]